MVSGFTCECHGFMSDEELGLQSFLLFLAGTNREGWFTNDDLVKQSRDLSPLFVKLHPECEILVAFDNSMNHHKRCPDGLDADLLPLKDGGKNAPLMHDTWYIDENGVRVVQLMQNEIGQQKGQKSILKERGKWRENMNRSCVACTAKHPHGPERENFYIHTYLPGHWIYGTQCCSTYCLSQEPDFLAQREWLREVLEDLGHSVIYYPKYHCELNYIEMIWAYLKAYLRRHCSYNFDDLRKSIPITLLTKIPLAFIRRAARHCFRAMDVYRHGFDGPLLDYALKVYKSHRRIPASALSQIRVDFETKQSRKNSKYTFIPKPLVNKKENVVTATIPLNSSTLSSSVSASASSSASSLSSSCSRTDSQRSFKIWQLSSELQKQTKEILKMIVKHVSEGEGNKTSYFPNHPQRFLQKCSFRDLSRLNKHNWLSGSLLSTFANLVITQIPDKGSCLVFNSDFYCFLSGEKKEDVNQRNILHYDEVKAYTSNLGSDYLQKKIVIDVHLPDHWIKAIMDPSVVPPTLYIIDGFKKLHPTVVKLLLEWRTTEVGRLLQEPETWTVVTSLANDNLRLVAQTDGTSCGVMSAMQGYYYLMFGKLPTIDDWTQDDVPELRIFMLHEIVRLSELLKTVDNAEGITSYSKTSRQIYSEENYFLLDLSMNNN